MKIKQEDKFSLDFEPHCLLGQGPRQNKMGGGEKEKIKKEQVKENQVLHFKKVSLSSKRSGSLLLT